MKYRYTVLAAIVAAILGWVEDSHGRIEAHDHSAIVTHAIANGYVRGYKPGRSESQLPGFVRVTMSQDQGVQIGPHRFRPRKGDLRFSLVKGLPEALARKNPQAEKRFYYEVIERDDGKIRVSVVDAVTGELIDGKTGEPLRLE